MKKLSVFLVFLLAFAFQAYATDAYVERIRQNEVKGWTIFGADDDIDTSAELITELDTTYAQLSAEDSLEVLSSDAADTSQTVTISGINDSGEYVTVTRALDTTNGTTVVTVSGTFRYVDQVSVDKECAGTITIRKASGDTFITSIPIGQLQATMAQHFNGTENTYLTAWRASVTTTTGTLLFQLRWYPDDADCLDAGDGFQILDEIQFTNVHGTQQHSLHRTKLPAGGWLAVYAIGGSNNADGSVTVWGFDSAN